MKINTPAAGFYPRPPFQLPKLADIRRPKFEIPIFDTPTKKICGRCKKGLPKITDRPFADLICSDCLKAWTEVEAVLDKYARGKINAKLAEKVRVWGGLINAK